MLSPMLVIKKDTIINFLIITLIIAKIKKTEKEYDDDFHENCEFIVMGIYKHPQKDYNRKS